MSTPSRSTWSAVVLAALLHLLIIAFLALAILSCESYEKVFEWLHLPASWNPIACSQPVQLPGPVIEATLIGPTGSPPPKAAKAKPVPNSAPPPPSTPPPPTPPTPAPKVKTLPPPPEHPDVKDQERVVEDAPEKAEDAKKLQEEKQRERQAELDAQAAKQKQQKQLDELFAKMDAASSQVKKADKATKQAAQQAKEQPNAKDDAVDAPPAAQKQTGSNGADNSLRGQYIAAIQNAVTQNWLRPDNMPDQSCLVHIVQLPGGQVLSATADASCPYDEAGRRSVENAVLRAQPLPYQGFEKVFQRQINITFRPQ